MTGICALCGTNAPLLDSHFMPRSLYQELVEPSFAIKQMIVLKGDKTSQSSQQFSTPLLCQGCEIRFQQGGENWTLANRYRSDGSFPIRDLLLNASPIETKPDGSRVYEARTVAGLHQAQSENMAPIDLISTLVSDELACRSKRLLERRHKQAQFRDAEKRLDNFDFQFNPKMNRKLVFDLATAGWVGRREDALFLGPPGSGKSHCAQAIGHAVIQQGYRVLYREAHALLEELTDATLDGKRKEHMELLTTVPLLVIDDLGMRKLPLTAAEELLEIIMRRYERASTLLTSNRPVDDWGKLLGDSAAVTAMLDRLLHHGHVLKCGPRSWRTKGSGPEEGK